MISAIAIWPKLTSIRSSMKADPGSDSVETIRVFELLVSGVGPENEPLDGELQLRPEALSIFRREVHPVKPCQCLCSLSKNIFGLPFPSLHTILKGNSVNNQT